ncbi:hypothetical protein LI99_25270 [Mycolicibacterium smegmatis]|nr:hypothetical protein LJ00_25265 [Mycolicibacterium smegmatis MC2 155]AIU16771.1 hypothetical protein LI99_25270 [Mycolicibacterium smegmatis]AIU23394.1 hypothetical protein LI98_25275 [Mycolicibacterium smegmatis]
MRFAGRLVQKGAVTSESPGDGVIAARLPGGGVLPFPPVPSASVAGPTLEESTYQPRVVPKRLHADSPNIVIVLIDDAGPGLPSTFGGEVTTSTLDRVCAEGVGVSSKAQGLQRRQAVFHVLGQRLSAGPHHIMKEWADRYAGKFDDGWDAYRRRVFDRANAKGWIPPNCELTERDPQLAGWDQIPEDEKPFQRRLMEVAAGYANARRSPSRDTSIGPRRLHVEGVVAAASIHPDDLSPHWTCGNRKVGCDDFPGARGRWGGRFQRG